MRACVVMHTERSDLRYHHHLLPCFGTESLVPAGFPACSLLWGLLSLPSVGPLESLSLEDYYLTWLYLGTRDSNSGLTFYSSILLTFKLGLAFLIPLKKIFKTFLSICTSFLSGILIGIMVNLCVECEVLNNSIRVYCASPEWLV